ncbi:MAG: hypothetical protein A2W52_03790 [Candidatus Taylorbacteria bacterium RIFCSPHIGHO2_02_49_25]|uniref:Uncharacterized protein n=1 Tax=Candidatus Taylorbacteria bacterium RIFCSPHIGHO2_02_49_25 TaxID=1802305 RepID=A0A1G2MFD6_9BACT|nr:MAG: hypothetical protein A2759_01715 [Candidatus Taylorbacteria bacterium RIFCSPHIGHO2_01_FULL_49_60]OHA22543.1 MAG: hypothetical protein A2W52_03790 [Candidatus Taylorbacteria bacterium RIFCSPHIGHO2_02_49_25]OHA36738.1 MAG: hypothetical protein A2W65_01915 [Candidatus Taylorbacteria bacterium RIFCSPLOWO2_02_50_13]OHA42533.1 MAG: hypothetical protein A3H73_04065 [Candidatus Taylorbacteria bacterium RIFCSPLOWO2_02_FULL_50_120]OHA47805.1 MAG: hypothetical protein A3G61_03295 [Candidatus Taylo
MLSWAQQRKLLFVMGAVALLLAVSGAYGFFAFYNAPNCSNGVEDGNERGIDCGGDCIRVCAADIVPPIIHFVRAVQIRDDVWGAVAYGENKNRGVGSRRAPYVFKLYDDRNLLIYERHGTAFIPPDKVFAIFEGRMFTGGRVPTRTAFDFEGASTFERMAEPKLTVDTKDFETGAGQSSLRAIITNPTRLPIERIDAIALLFGTDGNVSGASATFISILQAQSNATLTFTWPRSLPRPARTEVHYKVLGRE